MASISLPETIPEWMQAAGRQRVRNQSLWQNVKLHSASQVTYKQYLLFRTIVPSIISPEDLNVQHFGIAPRIAQANQVLSDLAFVDYLTNVTDRDTQPYGLWGGNDRLFRIPAIQQQEVIQGEVVGGGSADQSEATVNTACISFLQAIADLIPQSTRQWTACRIKLEADFSTQRRERRFVAYTDGHLKDISNGQTLALIECKKSRREKHSPAVDMQEVAQMVALVKQHPLGPNRRVLVAQDGAELYVSVFEYDQGWLRYLNGGSGSIAHAGFAYMRRYGPWNIRRASDMEHFALIITALLHL
ncbi:hypothetical protein BDW42DRAFT_202517 [Aspergillus taichungensis]|uniref:Uncharacterized protein n=1 Tax=Aspergillus taichungensis TaxID=482145 RepID=A0A2J5HKL6_9EURO|nr:hypothetical protein BDW42DRAFT_202517 [Aspergillus taichungensis]